MNNNRQREVSLIQVFWKVLMGWKILLAFAIIFAVLVPGFRYWTGMREYNSAMQAETSGEEETLPEFTAEEQQQIDDVYSLKVLLEQNRSYMEHSALMNIDPYHENVLNLQYYVDSDYMINYTEDTEPDYTSVITNAYVEIVNRGLDQDTIWAEINEEQDELDMEGLISAGALSSTTFNVRVIYSDQMSLKEISRSIQKALNARSDELSEKIGSHELVLLSESISVQADRDLASSQSTVQELINTYRSRITSLMSNMTEEQLEVLGAELQNTELEEEEPEVIEKPAFSKVDIVLGFVLGFVLAGMLLACIAIMSNKLQETRELVDLYGLRQFAVVPKANKKKGLTALLLRIKNCRRKLYAPEAALNLAVSNIALYCKKEGIHQLLLTGSEIEQVDKSLIKNMMDNLAKSDINVIYGENVCYDAAAMCQASEAGYVVLIEVVDVSIYQEIEKEIRMLRDQNVEILGCIGME